MGRSAGPNITVQPIPRKGVHVGSSGRVRGSRDTATPQQVAGPRSALTRACEVPCCLSGLVIVHVGRFPTRPRVSQFRNGLSAPVRILCHLTSGNQPSSAWQPLG